MGRRWSLGLIGVVGATAGIAIAYTYIPRLSAHEGYALVPVADALKVPPRARPRHAVLVVVDGLRQDSAEGMASVAALRAVGQCARTWVGVPSVSRPVYAVLSTGLEQDRTGARNNRETAPLSAESIWEVANAAGLRVEGRSETPWWSELFPRGFDAYLTTPQAMVSTVAADLTLLHPVYADDAAHEHGAASEEYRQAVARADREITALLANLDGRQDLLVLTADHGHRDAGGHGGPSPEIAYVLTCFAGRGVARRPGTSELDSRSVAPALAVLLGLPFPRHMRAGEDGLDAVFGIADPAVLGEAYLRDRAGAVDRFRRENRRALLEWSGGAIDRWSAWYHHEERKQGLRGLAVLLAAVVLLARSRALLPWIMLPATAAIYAGLAGGLDATSINTRAEYLWHGFSAAILGYGLAVAVRSASLAGRQALGPETLVLVEVLMLANAAHLAAFGWPLGFPIPSPELYFAPFLTSIALIVPSVALLGHSLRRAPR